MNPRILGGARGENCDPVVCDFGVGGSLAEHERLKAGHGLEGRAIFA